MRFTPRSRLLQSSRGLALRTLVLALAAIALMLMDRHYDLLPRVRGALMTAVYPAQWLVNAPAAGLRELGTDLASRAALLAENSRLKQEQLLASAHLERLDSLEAENRRLRALLNTAGTMRGRVKVASVLSINTDAFSDRVTVNAGASAGVHKGQPVLDANGIVGQTLQVGPISTQVMLITDPASAVPVEIERTGLATLAVGTGSLNLLSLPYLPNNADVKAGDRLLASGLGGLYPRGYPVGVVTAVTPHPGKRFADVEAQPLARLGREHQVLLYFAGEQPRGAP
ncbi:MAG: rod shape-determining protein MreC [Gammaproteobacteria bacterium]